MYVQRTYPVRPGYPPPRQHALPRSLCTFNVHTTYNAGPNLNLSETLMATDNPKTSKRVPFDMPAHVAARLTAAAGGDDGPGVSGTLRALLVALFGPDLVAADGCNFTAPPMLAMRLVMARQYDPQALTAGLHATITEILTRAAGAPVTTSVQTVANIRVPALQPVIEAEIRSALFTDTAAPNPEPKARMRRDDPHETTLRDLVDALERLDPQTYPESFQGGCKTLTTPMVPPVDLPTFKLDPITSRTVIRYGHLCCLLGLVPDATDEFGSSTSLTDLRAFHGTDGDWWVSADADEAISRIYSNLTLEPVKDYIRATWSDILGVLTGDPYLGLDFAR